MSNNRAAGTRNDYQAAFKAAFVVQSNTPADLRSIESSDCRTDVSKDDESLSGSDCSALFEEIQEDLSGDSNQDIFPDFNQDSSFDFNETLFEDLNLAISRDLNEEDFSQDEDRNCDGKTGSIRRLEEAKSKVQKYRSFKQNLFQQDPVILELFQDIGYLAKKKRSCRHGRDRLRVFRESIKKFIVLGERKFVVLKGKGKKVWFNTKLTYQSAPRYSSWTSEAMIQTGRVYSVKELFKIGAKLQRMLKMHRSGVSVSPGLSTNKVNSLSQNPAMDDSIDSRNFEETSNHNQPVIRPFVPINYTSGPVRQPIGPPEGEALQHHAGFAKFLKTHLSPRHHRVTAGGKVVPADPSSPPPTFHMDFIESLAKASREAERTSLERGEARNHSGQQMNRENSAGRTNVSTSFAPRVESNERTHGYGPYEDTDPHNSGQFEQRSPRILEAIPQKYKIKQILDDCSAIVESGSTTLYALLGEDDRLSLQTMNVESLEKRTEHFKAPKRPVTRFPPEMYAPYMFAKYQSMDGAATMPAQSTMGMCPMTAMSPASKQGPSHSPHTANLLSLDFDRNSPYTGNGNAHFGVLGPQEDPSQPNLRDEGIAIDLQLSEATNVHTQLKAELTNLERTLALHSDGMAEHEFRMAHVKKRHLILELDRYRLLKRDLEAKRLEGIRVRKPYTGAARAFNSHALNYEDMGYKISNGHGHLQTLQERRRSKQVLSANAQEFVPGLSNGSPHIKKKGRGQETICEKTGNEPNPLVSHSFPLNAKDGGRLPVTPSPPSMRSSNSRECTPETESLHASNSTPTGNSSSQEKTATPNFEVNSQSQNRTASRGMHVDTERATYSQKGKPVSLLGGPVYHYTRAEPESNEEGSNTVATTSKTTAPTQAQAPEPEEVLSIPIPRKARNVYNALMEEKKRLDQKMGQLNECFTWAQIEGESQSQYAMRARRQREIHNEIVQKLNEAHNAMEDAAEQIRSASTQVAAAPWVGDKAYNRQSQYAFKAPSSLASPIFKAAGTIACKRPIASKSLESANALRQSSEPTMRGGGVFIPDNRMYGEPQTPRMPLQTELDEWATRQRLMIDNPLSSNPRHDNLHRQAHKPSHGYTDTGHPR